MSTPRITWFKEIVTAALGAILIIGILVLIWPCLASSPADIASAQGIFSILGGWGGIVLGYYFGRLPAERAAVRAEAAAAAAEETKDIAKEDQLMTLTDSKALMIGLEKKLIAYESEIDSMRKRLEKLLGD